jgi:hypothetical protein
MSLLTMLLFIALYDVDWGYQNVIDNWNFPLFGILKCDEYIFLV